MPVVPYEAVLLGCYDPLFLFCFASDVLSDGLIFSFKLVKFMSLLYKSGSKPFGLFNSVILCFDVGLFSCP